MNVREALNKMKWHTKDLDHATVVIRHRGAPGDEKTIKGRDILKLESWYMLLREADKDTGNDDEVVIPYHRILTVKVKDDIIWEKRGLPT